MGRGDGVPSADEGLRIHLETKSQTRSRLEDCVTQGVKGVAVLNGGGIVAMLGFAQALAGKGNFHTFKPFGLWAGAFFLAGAILTAIIFVFRHEEERARFVGGNSADVWGGAVFVGIFLSIAMFVVGAVLVGFGIYFRL